ncbi:hypothetical protein ACFYP6_34480 [Streptomyces goshikiensis]|uniref:hypothetical protein n=1 Tax=Streptomyces goshikiensis TaxID=1942 RepID=UPI0036BDC048
MRTPASSPARNEAYGYGVAIAYLEASGNLVDTVYEPWRNLVNDIRGALSLDSYAIAERLRSLQIRRA